MKILQKPGIPESFKVLLKELQSLALDVRVLKDDQTEVEIGETIDYGDSELAGFMSDKNDFGYEDESLGDYGYERTGR